MIWLLRISARGTTSISRCNIYGMLLSLTAILILANAVILTVLLSEGSAWARCKLALWQALTAISGLGIGVGFPLGHHALLRLGELVHRVGH